MIFTTKSKILNLDIKNMRKKTFFQNIKILTEFFYYFMLPHIEMISEG